MWSDGAREHELEVGLCQTGIQGNEELSHEGGPCDFGRFAGGAKPLVNHGKHGVDSGGCDARHVEGGSESSTPASDAAFALERAAIALVRSQSRQRADLPPGERSQLRSISEDCKGGGFFPTP